MRKRRTATWNAKHPTPAARIAAAAQVKAETAIRAADPITAARDADVRAAIARIDAIGAAPLARGNGGFSLFKC